jgi:pseudaminic acid biosynthesis-associated methylase
MSNIELWKGKFGDEYTKRNDPTEADIANREDMWMAILNAMYSSDRLTWQPHKILEIGAGSGQNLIAINNIFKRANITNYTLSAVEPNKSARNNLKDENLPFGDILDCDASAVPLSDHSHDLVFTSGLLIHIPEEDIMKVAKEIYRISKRYIVINEYFSPEPRELLYRGEKSAMWSRDYGSLFLDRFGVRVIGYGFCWKPVTGLDNTTWFMFEKVN